MNKKAKLHIFDVFIERSQSKLSISLTASKDVPSNLRQINIPSIKILNCYVSETVHNYSEVNHLLRLLMPTLIEFVQAYIHITRPTSA